MILSSAFDSGTENLRVVPSTNKAAGPSGSKLDITDPLEDSRLFTKSCFISESSGCIQLILALVSITKMESDINRERGISTAFVIS